MLTELFHERYAQRVLWTEYGEEDKRLNIQLYRVVSEQLFSMTKSGSKDNNQVQWENLESRLSLELGVENLSRKWPDTTTKGPFSVQDICRNFMLATFDPKVSSADTFMKQRVSFIELALRMKAEDNQRLTALVSEKWRSLGYSPEPADDMEEADPKVEPLPAWLAVQDDDLVAAIDEVNARFASAGKPLNLHNGYVQIFTDELVESSIEKPFWQLVSDPKWANVDTDLKEATDRRDTGGRDPAFYAAKALESTIKILSGDLKATLGGEKGAANYIDNLISARSNRFIEVWEGDMLKAFFTSVRNPHGHGPGDGPMPKLSKAQTDWAIEFAMIWIKSLIGRVPA